MTETDFPSRGFEREILKVMVIMHLSRHGGYPYALLKAIQGKKIWMLRSVTKSDLYNAIAFLEKRGFIRSKTMLKGAVARKNYFLTMKGKGIVKSARERAKESFREVLKEMNEI